jgi:hypothetical protein
MILYVPHHVLSVLDTDFSCEYVINDVYFLFWKPSARRPRCSCRAAMSFITRAL